MWNGNDAGVVNHNIDLPALTDYRLDFVGEGVA
jgi:hypothetical protein